MYCCLILIHLLFFLIAVISYVQCQNVASVDPSLVEKAEGDFAEILCRYGKQIDRCRFEQLGTRLTIKLWEGRNSDGYSYFGEGLDRGQCGLRIESLRREHEGNWTCVLDLGDNSDDVIGDFKISIARAPKLPELYIQDQNQLREGSELYADCVFRDGKPSGIVRWFLGEEEITSHDETLTEQNGYETVTSKVRRILRADDNLKSLTCRVEHTAFENGYTNTTHQLQVNYPPQAISRNELYVGSLTIGNSADIAITIRSNPKPLLEWTVDGKTLKEGTTSDRFVVKEAEQVDDGRYLAKLTVIQLTLEDVSKTFLLRARNNFGTQDYPIRIGGSPDENGKRNLSFCYFKMCSNSIEFSLTQIENLASGLGIVAIIGIAIAALVVLVIVALLVVARITKRWCFAGKHERRK